MLSLLTADAAQGGGMIMIVYLVLIVGFFYFFLMRPQKKEPERMVVNVDYALDINYEYLADCQIVMDIRSKGSAEKLIV